ncbi:PREDICTED: uncharacterized protein LOC109160792 [Ipomoea nil]|uniref:uncharacterized protein LOC109160792 n=1 Tax=Ipomoea nil TaxID=35883 RepID=UPI0009014AA9|nr:PREDICTED: uncharacterized protein LOC109160792 [Ipomoea nil]
MAAHDLVCSGVRRRIGNGKATLIWGHPWLPDDPSPLQTLMPNELREALVVGLTDQSTNTWDPHILSDLFIPEDVARITRIPVSPDYEDSWYWVGDPKGMYTVKNAYRQIMGEYMNNPDDQTRLAIGVLYYLWRARNSAVWDKAIPRPRWTAMIAARAEKAYSDIHCNQQQPTTATAPEDETHHRPRCYFDAGY